MHKFRVDLEVELSGPGSSQKPLGPEASTNSL